MPLILMNPNRTPKYFLTHSVSTVDEGQSVTITLQTRGLVNGSIVPYTITGTGITPSDFSGLSTLTGTFTIFNDSASVTFVVAADVLIEGSETFTVTIDGENVKISTLINDLSVTSYIDLPLTSDFSESHGYTVNVYGSTPIVSVGGYNGAQFGPTRGVVVPISPEIGGRDFVLEFYMYRASGSLTGYLCSIGNYVGTGNLGVYLNASGTFQWFQSASGSTTNTYTAITPGAAYFDRWVKVTVTRTGTKVYLAFDGVQVGNPATVTATYFTYESYANHNYPGGFMLGCCDGTGTSIVPAYFCNSTLLHIRDVTFDFV